MDIIYYAMIMDREIDSFLRDRETMIAAVCHVLEMDIEDILIKAAHNR